MAEKTATPVNSSWRMLEIALILMHKQYEAGIDSKKVDREPISLVRDWIAILEVTEANLRKAGHAR